MGLLFQEANHRWKLQVDIATMIMAWGLQIGEHELVVGWVMKELFEKDLIPNLDALLEWAHSGWAFDFSEGYEDEAEGIEKGVVSFLNWPRGFINQETYTNERHQAWNVLKCTIMDFKEEESGKMVPSNFPKGKRSARSKGKS